MVRPPLVLRITDYYTRRSATLRLADSDRELSLGQVLERYIRHLPRDALVASGAISADSLRSLTALQDLVYSCDDAGQLKGIYSGIVFRQGGRAVGLDELPESLNIAVGESAADLMEITVDRANAGYDRNWKGFSRRRWDQGAAFFEPFVQRTIEEAHGEAESLKILALDDPKSRLLFLKTLARRIWEAPFENYSRFTGDKLLSKTGDETVRNIVEGAGGICTEKVQALKFLTDHFGFESEFLLGGDRAQGVFPTSNLREMLRTFDFRFGRRFMRYWQHAALLYQVDGKQVLVDATNGNIPFLFLVGEQAEVLLREQLKEPIEVRMVEAEERYFYHRVPQDIPLDLFFAMEGWITDADLVQVFENELGLSLSRHFYVTPVLYRSDSEFERQAAEYYSIARRAGFPCHVSRDWSLESNLGRLFASQEPMNARGVMAAKDHLLLRYNEWDTPGNDAGLAIMHLSG